MRIFYNIRSGDEFIEDLEGTEYTTMAEARAQAVRSAREIMAGRVFAGKQPDSRKFEVVDDAGRVVFMMPFLDALDKDG